MSETSIIMKDANQTGILSCQDITFAIYPV